MHVRRAQMGQYVVDGDTALSVTVEGFCTFEYPDNLADLVFVSPLLNEGSVVIDAGACIGDQTVMYSQMVGATGHVYAFEPHPVSYQALVKNTARLNNVTTFPYGLSDVADVTHLNTTPNLGASFIGLNPAHWPQELIGVKALDEILLPRLSRCDLIHLDAEGFETKILRGAKALIQTFQPALMVEVVNDWLQRTGSSEAELYQTLHAWGYEFQTRTTPGAQYDMVAIPKRMQRHFLDTTTTSVYTESH